MIDSKDNHRNIVTVNPATDGHMYEGMRLDSGIGHKIMNITDLPFSNTFGTVIK